VHRDVKPANVLLTFSAGPQLLDFNLAHEPHNAERAEAALRGGTLPYMAPEQLEAFLDPEQWESVGEPADLYALGLLLSELLTGERPEPPDPALPLPRAIRGLLDQRASSKLSLRDRNPSIPHALNSIAARCLSVDPSDRYPSARTVAEDLERFLARRPLRHAPNPSKAELARNWTRRHRLALTLAAVTLVAVPSISYLVTEGPDRAPHYVTFGLDWLKNKHDTKQARASFERALQLDSNLYPAYHGLAAVASQEGLLEQSYDYLTKAIEAAERAPALSGKRREETLANLYDFRAAMARRLANEEQSRLTPEAFAAAKPYYDRGLKDLQHARQFYGNVDPGTKFNIDFETARIELGQGDVASNFDDYVTSVTHFTRSMSFLQQALALNPAEPGLSQALQFKRDLEMRLSRDGSVLRQELEAPEAAKASGRRAKPYRSSAVATTVSLESSASDASRH
ncbi:MAG TPA: protein kinase, partial [Isosphaeraceae bacterium]|nr:protein kinase [Isosphaeraceae bacterium]